MEDDFTAQVKRFVRSAVFCVVKLGSAFRGWCFWGVGCGCDIGICVLGCCFEAVLSRQVSAEGEFGGWECFQNGSTSFETCAANFADMKVSCRHFSWQAQCFVRVGGVEVHFSWQGRGVVRLRGDFGFWRKMRQSHTRRVTFGGGLVRHTRFADLTQLWRKSRAKRWFWRLDDRIVEEVPSFCRLDA